MKGEWRSFKFRFATLLRLREAVRDEQRQELAKALEAEKILRRQILQVDEDLASLHQRARAMASPGEVDVRQVVGGPEIRVGARGSEEATGGARGAVCAEIERRRQALVEANREVQILERLRQRQNERRREEENRREIRTLDEVAQIGALRNRTRELQE